jgi:hypothetical protein
MPVLPQRVERLFFLAPGRKGGARKPSRLGPGVLCLLWHRIIETGFVEIASLVSRHWPDSGGFDLTVIRS